MIQINNYDTIVAYATPTTKDSRITDKLVTGNYLILDPQASDYTYTITKNGSEIPVTSIAANEVIPVSYTHLDVYKRQVLDRMCTRTDICSSYLRINYRVLHIK